MDSGAELMRVRCEPPPLNIPGSPLCQHLVQDRHWPRSRSIMFVSSIIPLGVGECLNRGPLGEDAGTTPFQKYKGGIQVGLYFVLPLFLFGAAESGPLC